MRHSIAVDPRSSERARGLGGESPPGRAVYFHSDLFRHFSAAGLVEGGKLKLARNAEGIATADLPVLPEGEFEHPHWGVLSWTREVFADMRRNFAAGVGSKPFLNLDHAGLGMFGDSKAPAAGWPVDLFHDEQAGLLMAHTELTDLGEDNLANRRYRYTSAEVWDEFINSLSQQFDNYFAGLALTNRPFHDSMPGTFDAAAKPICLSSRGPYTLWTPAVSVDGVAPAILGVPLVSGPMQFQIGFSGETYGVTGYQGSMPLADRGRAWDAGAARGRMKSAASSGDSVNMAQYRKGHFWFKDGSENLTDCKLPYADVVGGKLTAIPRGIFAVAARLDGTDIPDADKARVRSVVSKWYARMRTAFGDESITTPWEKGSGTKENAMPDEETITLDDGVVVEPEPVEEETPEPVSLETTEEPVTLDTGQGGESEDDQPVTLTRAQLAELQRQAQAGADANRLLLEAAAEKKIGRFVASGVIPRKKEKVALQIAMNEPELFDQYFGDLPPVIPLSRVGSYGEGTPPGESGERGEAQGGAGEGSFLARVHARRKENPRLTASEAMEEVAQEHPELFVEHRRSIRGHSSVNGRQR